MRKYSSTQSTTCGRSAGDWGTQDSNNIKKFTTKHVSLTCISAHPSLSTVFYINYYQCKQQTHYFGFQVENLQYLRYTEAIIIIPAKNMYGVWRNSNIKM